MRSFAYFPIPDGFPATYPATARAWVNHCHFKSRECFQFKIDKGNPCNITRKMDQFTARLAARLKETHCPSPSRNGFARLWRATGFPLPEAAEAAPGDAALESIWVDRREESKWLVQLVRLVNSLKKGNTQ